MIDWATVVVALFAGLGSGVIGTFITTATQRKLARSSARAEAAKALWGFQRTLRDYASEGQSHYIDDGSVTMTKTTNEDIAAARALAYPYRGYLKDKAPLVERHWHAEGWPDDDPTLPYDDVEAWAKELADALAAVFGNDPR